MAACKVAAQVARVSGCVLVCMCVCVALSALSGQLGPVLFDFEEASRLGLSCRGVFCLRVIDLAAVAVAVAAEDATTCKTVAATVALLLLLLILLLAVAKINVSLYRRSGANVRIN